MGYGYKTASGLVVEPQFQYSMVDVDLDPIAYNSYDYELTDGDSTEMRIGVALRKSYKTAGGNYWTPYGALSYLDESDGANTYQIGGLLDGSVDISGGSTLVEAGATGLIGKFGISGGINWRDGGAYDSVVGGQLSVRYDW
jgi:outer membrane autotransporter protein